MTATSIYLNGIDGDTGAYLVRPIDTSRLAAIVRGEPPAAAPRAWLKGLSVRLRKRHLGLPIGVDPADVAQAGWAIVFQEDEKPEIRRALAPLVEHRRAEVGDERTHVLEYCAGDEWRDWLARHGVRAGTVDPTKVGYYVLLVGEPSAIPYEFQFLLDVEYGVGRVSFASEEGYRRYAESLIDYETSGTVRGARRAVFFGTRHDFDPATQLSADLLVAPLADAVAKASEFTVDLVPPEHATKSAFTSMLAGVDESQPAFCFTATHGVGFRKGHARQLDEQGALVCQDWPRLDEIDGSHYFSARDVPGDASVHGLIMFNFACFGAGTPMHDSFPRDGDISPSELAEEPFVAELPKALLGHSTGGALAVIGHVDRAFGCSIGSAATGPQLLPFQNTVEAVLRGYPVGYACKDFDERYATLSVELSEIVEKLKFQAIVPDDELVARWLERNDARNYVVVGDPAAHLRPAALADESGT